MSKRVFVSDLTHTQQTIANNTIPFAVGTLVTYAKAKLKDPALFEFKIFKYPDKLIEAILNQVPDIACFSNYVWNLDLSYAIAKRIYERNPRAIFIFGGPNYSTDPIEQEKFLRDHPLIHFMVFKEGEIAFTDLLQHLADNNFDVEAAKKAMPRGCHYLLDGQFKMGPFIERIKDLDDIPSAYLTGEMNQFFDSKLIPIVQTNRGCPFSCTFCVEGLGYYNKVNKRTLPAINAELEFIAAHRHPDCHDLVVADSNFGMYREDEEIADMIARIQKERDWPKYLYTTTGKNQQERILKVARTLKGALKLSGSVQSLTQEVLENIKRKNISATQLMELAQRAREFGSNTYSEAILALPGESKETHFRTIEIIVNAKFNWVRLYTLMMLAGTEMSAPDTRDKYKMQTRYRVLPRCFGNYKFGDENPVVAAEIEEVCIATKDMSFEDYLDCRLFHLTVEIFFNDSIASELVEFLNLFNVSVFDWLVYIHNHRDTFPEPLKKLYTDFYKETRDELWPSREELEKFIEQESVIEKYTSGQYGKNLIFSYKALALRDALKEVVAVAYNSAQEILQDKSPDVLAKYSEYLSELRKYSELRKIDVFNTARVFPAAFHYDFLELEAAGFKTLPDAFHRPDGISVNFFHTEDQKNTIDSALKIYGRDVVGVSRILTKIYFSQIYRTLVRQNPS